jgi:TfoX/Sxy family transcriptional regulator of competence genes
MAYDETLAQRIREIVQSEDGLREKKMFGGLAFLVNGNMAVAASAQGGLLLRVDPGQTEQLIQDADATRFVMRGREMDGWLRIDPAGTRSEDTLGRWVGIGVAHARSLPPK